MFKLGILIFACGLFCLICTAAAIPHHEWLSPYGVSDVHYLGSWSPIIYPHSYPVASFHYGYVPVYYNAFDPWWAANIYGPVHATYYWSSWGW